MLKRVSGKLSYFPGLCVVLSTITSRALIMAQTTMNIYASDQIFKCALTNTPGHIPIDLMLPGSYVTRIIGTFAGLCLGLLSWYIGEIISIRPCFVCFDVILMVGAARGPHIHYGIAASTAVSLVPIMWLRLYSPIQYQAGVTLFCVSASCGWRSSQPDNVSHHRPRGLLLLAIPGSTAT